jgi:ferrous iron transport protein A
MSQISTAGDQTTPVQNSNGPTIPISFLKQGDAGVVMKVSGREEIRKFLSGLGFIAGTKVRIVTFNNNGLILDVKGSRIAIDGSMASKIYVTSS